MDIVNMLLLVKYMDIVNVFLVESSEVYGYCYEFLENMIGEFEFLENLINEFELFV